MKAPRFSFTIYPGAVRVRHSNKNKLCFMKKLFLCFCAALFAITGMCVEPVVYKQREQIDIDYGTVVYEQHFGGYDYEYQPNNGWRITDVDLGGLDYVWKCDYNYGMKASAYYNGSAYAAESWLISPEIDLTSVSYNIGLFVSQAVNKGESTNLMVLVSTDNGNNWKYLGLDMPRGDSWDFYDTGIYFSKYAGRKIRLAFVYKSTTSICPTWEIKNIKITEKPIDVTCTIVEKDGIVFRCFDDNETASVIDIQPEKQGDITIPESISYDGKLYKVTTIEVYAFAYHTGSISVTIPESVERIEGNAFIYCTGLTSVTILNSATSISIGEQAFSYCTALTSITIPERVNYIGIRPFSGCISLTSVVWNARTCKDKDSSGNYYRPPFEDVESQITSFTFGNKVRYIPAHLCKNMDKLTSVAIPNSVTSIGNYACSGCTGLTSVTIGNSVTGIGEGAFNGCSKLSELHLGAGLETVGANAFAGCLRLGNIHCYAALPPLAEESSFANYNARLYVPCEVLGDYQLAIVFGNFKYIDCISSDGVDVPNNTVTVTPSYEDATFTWPSNGNANAYTLEITKDGVVFCTLTFNANGQLMGIAFAPSKDRNNARVPQAAQATINGWQFTVKGLNEGSNYAYTMTVTDNGNKVLQTYEGTFTTLGGDLPEGLTQTSEVATGIQKIISDGQVLILRNGKTYTLTGQEVR